MPRKTGVVCHVGITALFYTGRARAVTAHPERPNSGKSYET